MEAEAGRKAREESGGPELWGRQGHPVKAEGARGLGWVPGRARVCWPFLVLPVFFPECRREREKERERWGRNTETGRNRGRDRETWGERERQRRSDGERQRKMGIGKE